MAEEDRTTDELYDEMAKDPTMRTVLGLDVDGPSGLNYLPKLDKLSGGVLRIGTTEETTQCWWRVPDPLVLLGDTAGAPTDARRALLEIMSKELTAARHKLQSLTFDHLNTPHATRVHHRETHLLKAVKGVSNAQRVVEAAKTTRRLSASVSASSTAEGATAASSTAVASIDPSSGLPFYVVGGTSTWDHPTRPVVASILHAASAVGSLKCHESDLQRRAEPNDESDDDEEEEDSEEEHPDDASDAIDPYDEFDEETRQELREAQKAERRAARTHDGDEPYRLLDPAFDSYPKLLSGDDDYDPYTYGSSGLGERRTNRQEALRCKEGDTYHSRNKRRRSAYDYYDDFGRRSCNCADATLIAACRAESHLLKIAAMLRLPPATRPVPQFMYTPAYYQPYPPPTADATDDGILTAAASDAHTADLRAFLRNAAAKGHEVLIKHSVG